jgi:hypothetical protein
MPTGFRSYTVFNLVVKLMGFGSVFLIADSLFPGLYQSLWFPFYTVLTLTTVGTIADLLIVPRLGNRLALFFGFFGMTIIIWAIAKLGPYNRVSMLVAALLALCLGPLEFGLHEVILYALGYRKRP